MRLRENIPLAPFTTLRIGGPARYIVRVGHETDLWEAVHIARKKNLPIFVLGGGSNLVVPDEGFLGMVLQIAFPESIVRIDTSDAVYFDVSAGTDWNALVLRMCEQGIAGMECLAGIPGLVGGAPVQNIGAYGQEVSSTIESVRALDLQTNLFRTLAAEDCHFSYRNSLFNSSARGQYIVTSVRFRLDPNTPSNLSYADLKRHFAGKPRPAPLEVYEAVRQIRAAKGMLIDPDKPAPESRSAGSFFKNPIISREHYQSVAERQRQSEAEIPHWSLTSGAIKLPAAWMIEQSGFQKGFEMGAVSISTKHSLALVNRTGRATCADLLRLRDHITSGVQERFGIVLEQEPVMLQPSEREA